MCGHDVGERGEGGEARPCRSALGVAHVVSSLQFELELRRRGYLRCAGGGGHSGLGDIERVT